MREPLRVRCALSLSEVAEAVGSVVSPAAADLVLGGVATDSRDVQAGDLFVARRGQTDDGHRFVGAALAAGAAALLAEERFDAVVPVVTVPDSTVALGDLARAWRRRLGLALVAVTGSNGKTTTKEMLAAILAEHAGNREAVLVTPGNWNNHVGLPLTLLGGRTDQHLGVVELGMSAPGEIGSLTAIAEPQVGVITNAAAAHLERFGGSVDGVARAKAELWGRMGDEAVAVVNLDDPRLPALAGEHRGPRLAFGQAEAADVRILRVEPDGARGLRVALGLLGTALDLEVPLVGRHHAWNLAAAAAAAHALGISAEAIRAGLAKTRLPAHRAVIVDLGGVVVLDDCYNANPASVRAAASALADLGGTGRLGAILGDLRELGGRSKDMHAELGRHLGREGFSLVIGLGPLSEALCAGARQGGMAETLHVDTVDEAARAAQERFRPGDRVLVKGSRAVGMEAVIDAWRQLVVGRGAA